MVTEARSELDGFRAFIESCQKSGGADLSPEEALGLWQTIGNERDAVNAIIRQGIEDIKAGRGRPVGEVMDELCEKYNLSRE